MSNSASQHFSLSAFIAVILIGLFWLATTFAQTSVPNIETTPEATVNYSNNTDWLPVTEKFDGVEMMLVPAGCFTMGATSEQIQAAFESCEANGCRRSLFENAQPAHEICFGEDFWIDRYEVSNAQIANFDGALLAGESHWSDDVRPRESISWLDAYAFCRARDARLPTEAEWEYAARGSENYVFPWGDQFDADKVVYRDNSDGETAPIGSQEGNVSWVGTYDMSGNVAEWTNTIYRSADNFTFTYPYVYDDGREMADVDSIMSSQRVLRGGSWQSDEAMITTWYRTANNAIDSSSEWGFRCVRSAD